MTPELEMKLARRGANILASSKRWIDREHFSARELCRVALQETPEDGLRSMYVAGTLELHEFEWCLDSKYGLLHAGR